MKRTLSVLALLLVAALALAYLYRTVNSGPSGAPHEDKRFVPSSTADFEPGPAIGSHFPGLQASYRGRRITLVQEFAGTKGTVVVATLSLDWCQYCRRQLLQLQDYLPRFEAAGIGLVVITYDPPEDLRSFIERNDISIPVLSDDGALTFRTLGILDERHEPGDTHYGLPHPGMLVLDSDNKVVAKLFPADFMLRVDAASALEFARRALETGPTVK
ncbi:MAG: redoxin domain-containing protein [Halioglobus sp.]|nr:redoxin domain-containing protein [Halioglobus sp.]